MARQLVLVIEDSPDIAEIFRMAFLKSQFDVEIVWNGVQAVARLDAVVPDVVILDLHLPRVSGIEVLGRIHTDPRLTNTYVIITSADPYLAGKMAEQADLVMIKPVTYGEVREVATRLQMIYSAGE